MNKAQKKVMIVVSHFPPKIGGVENYTYNLALGLQKKLNWEIIIVTSGDNKKVTIQSIEGLKVYTLPTLFTISNTPINPWWYFNLKKIIKEEQPGLINAHSPVPFLADMAALATGKTPFILTYHSPSMKKESFFYDPIIGFYESHLLSLLKKKSSKIICCSEFVRKTIGKQFNSKTVVIKPAVDTKIFKPGKSVKKDLNTILFIARHAKLYKIKGLYLLLKAINSLPNIHLKVIGEKINLKNPQVTFLGLIPHKKIYEEIQKAAVLVLPARSLTEGFGMVLIEALACKTPVIGTGDGGIPEIITNGEDGLLIPPNDEQALTQAIKKIVGHQNQIFKMGEKGFQKVSLNFRWEDRVDATQKVMAQYL